MSRKTRPADSLDFAMIFAMLAVMLIPDEIRRAMIALLDESITPEDERRLDEFMEGYPA